MLLSMRRWLPLMLAWGCWLLLYAAPVALGLMGPRATGENTAHMAAQALGNPAVVAGAAGNALVLLLAITAAFGLLWGLGTLAAAPLRLDRRIARAACLLAGWVWLVAANAWAFPASGYSLILPSLSGPVAWGACSAVLLVAAGAAVWAHRARWARGARVWGFGAAVAVVMLALVWPESPRAQANTQRSVVLIGVDSLSHDLMQAERARLPHLTQLLAQAERFDRAYTPLGRTYPAWMSILSGKAPAEHGALDNLRDPRSVRRDDLLSVQLQSAGFHTVYGIDERRFNTIDEAYGFERVVGPRPGLLDIVLQPVNDTPLSNALLQTRVGRWLLPDSAHNVAAIPSYDADGFVDEVLRAADEPAPLFLATHFLSGHFPFASRHVPRSRGASMRDRHIAALGTVDRQVGRLMAGLAAAGRLNDTLVIVLSDHGEALGHDEPYLAATGAREHGGTFGHGANLLSEHANRVVLGSIVYRDGQPVSTARTRGDQVSLMDVRPAAEAFLRTGAVQWTDRNACIPVETGLRLTSAADYRHLDPQRVAEEGASLHRLDEQGRITLREDVMPALVEAKDVGWRCADRLTIRSASNEEFRSFLLGNGRENREVPLIEEHVASIERYRTALRVAAMPATLTAAAP